MRTVFCRKPCCQGTQAWTQQVQACAPTLPDSCCSSSAPAAPTTGPPGAPGPGHGAAQAEPRPGAGRRLAPGVARGGAVTSQGVPALVATVSSQCHRPEPEAPLPLSAQGGPLTRRSAPRRRVPGRGAARSASCRGGTGCGGSARGAQPQSETCREGVRQRGADTGFPHSTRRPPRRAAGLGSQAPARVARACTRLRAHSLHRERRPRAEDSRRSWPWQNPSGGTAGLSDDQRSSRTAPNPQAASGGP